MTDLVAVTALGGASARVAEFGAIRLCERPDLALASVAIARGAPVPAPFGLALPGPGQATRDGALGAFWMGPGQWMIEAEGRADADFAAAVKAEIPDAAITEQTDAFSCVEITAPPALLEALMGKLVNLDAARFGPGQATRTGLEHMNVVIIRRDTDRLALLGMRSLAGSLWQALERAAGRLAA